MAGQHPVQSMLNVVGQLLGTVVGEIDTVIQAHPAAILKAAAQGHTSYNELIAAATDQVQVILSMLT
jgi:hypothetical protein